MEASSDLKNEIRKLRIDKAQRPKAPAASAVASTGPRRRLRLPIVLTGLGVALLGGYWSWGRMAPGLGATLRSAPEVRLFSVTARTDSAPPPVLTATGKIVSDHKVQVATKVSGQIQELMFEQGDRVTQGQVIARIEKTNFLARRDNAKAAFERARARLEYLEANFNRITGLHSQNDAGDIEYINVKSEFEAAKAQVAADEATLREAQWWLDECEVRAPISGVVLQRNVEVGDFVAAQGGFGGFANSQFGAVADMTKLRVEVDVSELDITRIAKDMPCTVTPDAYKDRKYPGHVMWLDPAANYSKATVQVKVRIENPDEFLRVEGSARVDFGSKPSKEAGQGSNVWIARSAILGGGREDAGAVFVFVDGRLHKTDVKIGRRTDREYEILSGLQPGNRIGADPKDYEDGQRAAAAGEK